MHIAHSGNNSQNQFFKFPEIASICQVLRIYRTFFPGEYPNPLPGSTLTSFPGIMGFAVLRCVFCRI